MNAQAPSPTFCRTESRVTGWTWAGGQNGDRPRADYFTCLSCGTNRVQLGLPPGAVTDVEALAANVLAEKQRRDEGHRLDLEDLQGHLVEAIWEAWRKYDVERGVSFVAYATGLARYARANWYREQLGRDTPKAHAWSVSLDGLAGTTESFADGEAGDAGSWVESISTVDDFDPDTIEYAIGQVETADTAQALRSIAWPVALGYSHGEVAAMQGTTEQHVTRELRKLRAELDSLR